MAAQAKYSLEEGLGRPVDYLLGTGAADLRKISPELVKARNVILADKIGSPVHKAGEEAINTLETIAIADRLYGEKAAVEIAALSGYNFRPLLDVMKKDADALGLEGGRLHEIYQKVLENKSTELHRLVAEMAPYNEILESANKKGHQTKSSAKTIHDFDVRVQRKKRERMRKVSIPMFALSSAVAGGLPAAAASLATLSGFSYGREAVYRLMEKAGEHRLPGKAIGKIESGLNKVGFSLPYGVILAGEKAVGMAIDWRAVALYTVVMQGAFVGGRKAKPYFGKARAMVRTLRAGWEKGQFWKKVDENKSIIEAEGQLQKAPDPGKQGLLRKAARYFGMMKFPLGKRKYVDLLGLGVRDRLDEKEVLEIAQKEFEGEFRKHYAPKVCYELMNEYLPMNSKVSEKELNKARGVTAGVLSTTITKESYDIRPSGGSDYTSIAAGFCEWGAENRIKALSPKEACDVQMSDGHVMACRKDGIILGPVELATKHRDITAFYGNGVWSKIVDTMPPETRKLHEAGNGAWSRFGPPRAEYLVRWRGEKIGGEVAGYIEEALREGRLAQFPKIGKGPDGKLVVEGWDLNDYEIYISDMLGKEEAVPLLYHEALHVGNRLEAFETLKKLGYLILNNEKQTNRPAGDRPAELFHVRQVDGPSAKINQKPRPKQQV